MPRHEVLEEKGAFKLCKTRTGRFTIRPKIVWDKKWNCQELNNQEAVVNIYEEVWRSSEFKYPAINVNPHRLNQLVSKFMGLTWIHFEMIGYYKVYSQPIKDEAKVREAWEWVKAQI